MSRRGETISSGIFPQEKLELVSCAIKLVLKSHVWISHSGCQTAMIIFHIHFVSFLYFVPESQNYGFAVRMGNILMVLSL